MKIGLVLSGGGARGFAHIGVLKVLKEHNIPIDYIAGCSAGALVGACYAYNQDIEALEKLVANIKNIYDIFDFSLSRTGLAKGDKVQQFVLEYLKKEEQKQKIENKKHSERIKENIMQYFRQRKKETGKNQKKEYCFEDLHIPLYVNATDVVAGKEVVFSKGPLMPAIMASIAYPGIFRAKKYEEKILVDGGVINPLPFKLIEDKVDYLILVNVSQAGVEISAKSGFKDIFLKAVSIGQEKIIEHELHHKQKPSRMIEPDITNATIIDFTDVKDIMAAGEKATKAQIAAIQGDIAQLSSPKDL